MAPLVAEIPSPDWPLIVLAGPTASGKTGLSVQLAQQLGAEIVSCDSVAVYKLMEIGSAKPSAEQRARVQHYCLDLYWPNEFCTAGDYARHARAAIAEIRSRGRLPIVTGGTGLYLRALLQGLAPAPPRDEALRERLRARAARRGPASLHRLLSRFDPETARRIHRNDTPKLIRSLEVTLTAGQPQSEQWRAGRDPLTGYNLLCVGLAPDRKLLHGRINERAAAMFAHGLIQETWMLRERFGEHCRALGALGYAQASAVLRGEISEADAIVASQAGHRQYAKRQMTWFRREPEMVWLCGFGDEPSIEHEALRLMTAHVRS